VLLTGRPLPGAASYPTAVGTFSVALRAVPTLVGPDQAGAPSLQFTGLIEVLVPFTHSESVGMQRGDLLGAHGPEGE
jgi:hypothetical protein